MANPSIGGATFKFLRGSVPAPAGYVSEEITAPYVDGIAVRRLQTRADRFQLQSAVDCGTDATAIEETYLALRGTLATVVDERSRTYTNVMVWDVSGIRKQAIGVSAGGVGASPAYWVTATWDLQRTTTDNSDDT